MANNDALRFANWEEALANISSGQEYVVYRQAILRFLHHCKVSRAPVTVMLAKTYVEGFEKQSGKREETIREALRWFVKTARTRVSDEPVSRSNPAPMAASDLGGADWERDLIRAVREKGFLWRTERTYREWGARFARFLNPRSPYVATKEDVSAFLSMLAVELRSGQASQKQALNALVFLMQEALHRDLGELDFMRSRKPRRVPTVLSREECARLFAQLSGTERLMAELAYGAGLRLMELLRLRVHHLDLERGQLKIYAGKGDKDRVTVLPERLQAGLRAQIERLRERFHADRAEGLSGVWLPEGLARQYPKAGVSWEWQWLFPSRETSVDPDSGLRRRERMPQPEKE